GPGRPPSTAKTAPVRVGQGSSIAPSARSCSRTSAVVACSSKLSSGRACSARRISTIRENRSSTSARVVIGAGSSFAPDSIADAREVHDYLSDGGVFPAKRDRLCARAYEVARDLLDAVVVGHDADAVSRLEPVRILAIDP